MSARTYSPTQRVRRNARAKGRVAHSAMLTALGSLACTAVFLVYWAPDAWSAVSGFSSSLWEAAGVARDISDVMEALEKGALVLLRVSMPVVLIAAVAAGLLSFLQVGPLWAPAAAAPDSSRLRWSGVDGPGLLMGFSVLVALVVVVVDFLAGALPGLIRLPYMETPTLEPMCAMLMSLGFRLLGVAAVFAGIDWVWTRLRYEHGLKLTRAQWLREQRLESGDPEIRRSRARLRNDLVDSAWTAQGKTGEVSFSGQGVVCILARDLGGEGRPTGAPRLIAKGAGLNAGRLISGVRAAGISVIDDPELVRELQRVRTGALIPARTHSAVARYFVRLGLEDDP